VFGENGKPGLKNGGFCFNLSHSGEYAVLATAGGEVGVDIEKAVPVSGTVAARCFTAAERDWMRRQGRDDAFFTVWTAKESVMKGFGAGFSLAPETFTVLPIDASPHRIGGKDWFLDWLAHDGHIICRAVSGQAEETEVTVLPPDELLKKTVDIGRYGVLD
jgi:phosphopantetheinyl transferase